MTVQPVDSLPDQIDRVWFEADRLLTFINEVATVLGVSIPERQYIDLGEPVHDCPAVAIGIDTTNTGLPGAPPAGIGEIGTYNMPPAWTLNLVADIIRCAAAPSPSAGTVSKAKLTAQVRQASKDWAVLVAAVNKRALDQWGYQVAGISFLEPQGTSYATRLNLAVAVH